MFCTEDWCRRHWHEECDNARRSCTDVLHRGLVQKALAQRNSAIMCVEEGPTRTHRGKVKFPNADLEDRRLGC